MATKKAPAKGTATKKTTKSTAKKAPKKATKTATKKATVTKTVVKSAPAKKITGDTEVSVLLCMAIESLILLLGYLIIINC